MFKHANAIAVLISAVGISVASAADLPRPAPAPAPVFVPPPFSWTGFYVGANIGGAWGERRISDSLFGLDFGRTSDGRFIGGGQIGYNYQFNNFVWGVEADFDGVASNGNGVGVLVPGVGLVSVRSNDTWISTLAARFGFANDHWLFYGKAGGGWIGRDSFAITNATTGFTITGNGRTESGFLGGAGVEYAFTNNWSVKLEYNYLGLSSRNFAIPPGSPFLVGDNFLERSHNIQLVKFGLNYAFK